MTPTPKPLYLQIALYMAHMVASGTLKVGQRLPSVRDSTVQNGVSVSTVVQAFRYLEERGLVPPRPWPNWWPTLPVTPQKTRIFLTPTASAWP